MLNFIHIQENGLQHFIRNGSIKPFIDMVSNGRPGTVAVIEVGNAWYRQYISEHHDNDDFTVFDLSSGRYRLNTAEKRTLLDKVCSEKNIDEMMM